MKEQTEKKKLLAFEKGGLAWSIWNFTEAALLLILGILAIVFVCEANGDPEKLNNTMGTLLNIVGIFLIVGGVLKIVFNFFPIFASNKLEALLKSKIKESLSYDLVVGGSLELALGIALVTMYSEGALSEVVVFLSRFLGIFIGVLMLVVAFALILFGVGFLVSKLYKIYVPIMEFVLAAILIGLGITSIVFLQRSEVMAVMVLVILAIVLILSAIVLTVVTIHAIKAAKEVKAVVHDVKEAVGAVIEAKEEPTQIEENEKTENQ